MIGAFGVPIVIVSLAIAFLGLLAFFARNYKKCPPNMALIITGRSGGPRYVTGGATFVKPVLEMVQVLPLTAFQVEVSVADAPNIDGVPVTVDAVANLKISSDEAVLKAGAERLLGKSAEELKDLTKKTLEGMLRQIVGRLTIEQVVKEREKIAQEVLTSAATELNKLGFQLDNFVFTKITDRNKYIEALGKKRTAEVLRDAAIGEAEAQREADEKSSVAKFTGDKAKLDNDAKTAEAQRDLDLKKAGFKKETETADATASMARQLMEVEIRETLVQREVAVEKARVTAQIGVAEQEVQRKEKELEATEIKPAEAKKRAAIITAEGETVAKVLQANADKQVTVAKAEADKVRLSSEGEGRATADAAQKRLVGEAEASATRAKGEAEGAAITARLLAEAHGLLKKNEALAQMGEAARLIIILEKLPDIIETAGEAGQKVVGSAFEHIGAGLSRIDSLNIVDMGGGNGNSPVTRYALAIPEIVFGLAQKAKALGINLDELLKPFGIDAEKLIGQFGKLSGVNTLKHVEK